MALFDTLGRGHHSQGIYFEVEGLEKAIHKLERLAEIDRKKARQFKTGIKKAAKPLVTSVKSSITNSKNKSDYTKTIQTKRSKDPAKRKYKEVTYKSGNLKKSIAFFPSRKRGALLGYVGARTGRRAGKTFDSLVDNDGRKSYILDIEQRQRRKRYRRYSHLPAGSSAGRSLSLLGICTARH